MSFGNDVLNVTAFGRGLWRLQMIANKKPREKRRRYSFVTKRDMLGRGLVC
jgi:hypothetical protein